MRLALALCLLLLAPALAQPTVGAAVDLHGAKATSPIHFSATLGARGPRHDFTLYRVLLPERYYWTTEGTRLLADALARPIAAFVVAKAKDRWIVDLGGGVATRLIGNGFAALDPSTKRRFPRRYSQFEAIQERAIAQRKRLGGLIWLTRNGAPHMRLAGTLRRRGRYYERLELVIVNHGTRPVAAGAVRVTARSKLLYGQKRWREHAVTLSVGALRPAESQRAAIALKLVAWRTQHVVLTMHVGERTWSLPPLRVTPGGDPAALPERSRFACEWTAASTVSDAMPRMILRHVGKHAADLLSDGAPNIAWERTQDGAAWSAIPVAVRSLAPGQVLTLTPLFAAGSKAQTVRVVVRHGGEVRATSGRSLPVHRVLILTPK